MAGAEINHPDHVVLFSWRTLTNLMSRHDWEVVETATFVPAVKAAPGSGVRQKVLGLAGRFVLWLERTIGRLWAPFVADGLIVTARSTRSVSPPGPRPRGRWGCGPREGRSCPGGP